MDLYTFYILFIFLIKFIYYIFALLVIYFTNKKNNKYIEIFTYCKKLSEFIFTILMSLLLIILFNPYFNETKLLNKKTQILLFAYGIIVLMNSQWGLFFKESKTFKILKNED